MTTLVTSITIVAFITKVISIPLVAVLGKINVDLVFTLVTKVTNVHVCPYGTARPYRTDVCEIPYLGGFIKFDIHKSIVDAVGYTQDGLHKTRLHL